MMTDPATGSTTAGETAADTTGDTAAAAAEKRAGEFERRRTHFADSFGPVCRVYGEDPLTSTDYRKITCGHCRSTGPFISALPEDLKPRSIKTRLWPESMQRAL